MEKSREQTLREIRDNADSIAAYAKVILLYPDSQESDSRFKDMFDHFDRLETLMKEL